MENAESFAGNGGGYLDDRERSVSADGGAWVDFEGWRRYFGAWREQTRSGVARVNGTITSIQVRGQEAASPMSRASAGF